MKKIILICTLLITSTTALAIDCKQANGITITGNNETTYCLSNNKMNWWTALGWCQSIGKTMFHYPNDCICNTEKCPETASECPNLKGIGTDEIWSSTPSVDTGAYSILLQSGKLNRQLHAGFGTRSGSLKALCK